MTFNELGLGEPIISAVTALGFKKPTPVQEQAIPYLLQQQGDLIALASTGTGKTAAFGLPMLQYIDPEFTRVQGLIVCPTRELCMQISKDLGDYSKQMPKVNIVPVYGGADIQKQIKQINKGAHIIVATPGRLIDLINRKKVKLNEVEIVVLDEADEMLNMGFKEDIDQILQQTPDFKNVWLFSATMPKPVARIAQSYMVDPFEITVGGKNETNQNIDHELYIVKEKDRYAAMKRLIDINPDIYGLVFCRTRRETGMVADKLMKEGYNAEALHGDMSQAQRDRVMAKFRNKTLQILVATDVAARGIDVDNITHVINYNLPDDTENYTHRSGRTARAGKKGISIVLINTREGRKISAIESIIGPVFIKKSLPAAEDICQMRLMRLIDDLESQKIDAEGLQEYMPQILEKLEHLSKEEIIQRFVASEFNALKKYYRNAGDLNSKEEKSRGGRDKGKSSREFDRNPRSKFDDTSKQRFFVSLGKKDGLNQGALLRLICDHSKVGKDQVGKIDILRNFSFFDASKEDAEMIVSKMNNVKFDGKDLTIELTKSGGSKKSSSKGKSKKKKHSKKRK